MTLHSRAVHLSKGFPIAFPTDPSPRRMPKHLEVFPSVFQPICPMYVQPPILALPITSDCLTKLTLQPYANPPWHVLHTELPDLLVELGVHSHLLGTHGLLGELDHLLHSSRGTLLELSVVHSLVQVDRVLSLQGSEARTLSQLKDSHGRIECASEKLGSRVSCAATEGCLRLRNTSPQWPLQTLLSRHGDVQTTAEERQPQVCPTRASTAQQVCPTGRLPRPGRANAVLGKWSPPNVSLAGAFPFPLEACAMLQQISRRQDAERSMGCAMSPSQTSDPTRSIPLSIWSSCR